MNNGILDIATAASVGSKVWKNTKISWLDFKAKLCSPTVTPFTLKEYMAMSKDEQGKVKDVGGYVGAFLVKGKRAKENVRFRQLLTLDIDYADIDFWDSFTMLMDCAGFIHSTHSHTAESPRLRLIIPLARKVTREQYQAVARKVADMIDIEMFDSTTFDINRLMFWPAVPKGTTMYMDSQEGPWLDPDTILAMYKDWTDSSTWPRHKDHSKEIHALKGKQEDPRLKEGLVGAFCRTYDIHAAIENFLSDDYVASEGDRYSYTKGSTSNGVITYDDQFSFSHHDTDPTSGRLCNSYDLVRIHCFGHLDTNVRLADSDKAPSNKAMMDMVMNDKAVMSLQARTKMIQAQKDFQGSLNVKEEVKPLEEVDMSWVDTMETNKAGDFTSTPANLEILIENHPHLKDLFWHDEFKERDMVTGIPPWDKRQRKVNRILDRKDFGLMRHHLAVIYNMNMGMKVEDGILASLINNSRNPLQDYLNSCQWDGVDRIDSFGKEYLGTEDSEYISSAFAKTFLGAVARAFKPGTKFDLVLVLVGSQGCGKSTFVKKFGKQWTCDSVMSIQGKDVYEQLKISWLIEFAELSAISSSKINEMKQFLTKEVDSYRRAYGRDTEENPRKCIFIGTTNDIGFLRDVSGNRRYLPVLIGKSNTDKNIFNITEETIDLIWAEAVHRYRAGESLFMNEALTKKAEEVQKEHTYEDDRLHMVREFLEKPITTNWYELSLEARVMMLESGELEGPTMKRDFCTPFELWTECLGLNWRDCRRRESIDMKLLLSAVEGWKYENIKRKRIKGFGKTTKYAYRINTEPNQDLLDEFC